MSGGRGCKREGAGAGWFRLAATLAFAAMPTLAAAAEPAALPARSRKAAVVHVSRDGSGQRGEG